MKNLALILLLCPLLILGNDTIIPSKISQVTVYLSGANITRTAECNLPAGTSEITLTGLSTKIDESSVQISGLQSVSILSMSYGINFMPLIEDKTESLPLQNRLSAIDSEIAMLKNEISGLEEEEQVIYTNRAVSGKTLDVSLQKVKEIGTYYRQRITAIKNEIFRANLKIKALNDETRSLQKQLTELNNVPEKEHGEIKIKFDAPVASNLHLLVSYQVTDAGWIPCYDIKSKDINTSLDLSYKAYVYQKTGNDWNDINITLSTGNPNINLAKPNLGTKYLNFTSSYQTTSFNAVEKGKYIYNPSVKQITGTVLDESGSPLPGANIIVKGTSNGTQSDFDGNFSLDVPSGQELVVSYLGYQNKEIPIYSSVMNIHLNEDTSVLEEVVVIGYGADRNSNITGAVGSIGAQQRLQGKVAGLSIRGNSSIGNIAEPQPLYVINGVPIDGFEEGDLDMDEIKSVEVLKGASATSIYGSRGVNGIIVITTKKSTAQDHVITTKFVIKKPYSIATNGDITAIEINTFTMNASYEYLAAPVINENVFLTASFNDWEQYNLLPGEANIYFKGAYAGKTTIDPYTTKKEMNLSLGIDPTITVTRTQRKNFKDKSTIGSNRILNRIYDLEVKNNKAVNIDLKLMDRVPISQNNDIKVSDIENYDAEYDDSKGLLVWKIKLNPQAVTKKSFSFKVKYPKHRQISL